MSWFSRRFRADEETRIRGGEEDSLAVAREALSLARQIEVERYDEQHPLAPLLLKLRAISGCGPTDPARSRWGLVTTGAAAGFFNRARFTPYTFPVGWEAWDDGEQQAEVVVKVVEALADFCQQHDFTGEDCGTAEQCDRLEEACCAIITEIQEELRGEGCE